jgi:hypothetical protein
MGIFLFRHTSAERISNLQPGPKVSRLRTVFVPRPFKHAFGEDVDTVTLHAVGAAPLDNPIYIQFRPSAKPAADIWAHALEAIAAIIRFQRTARCNSRRAPR